eukprot:s2980_g3.t1
MRDHLRPLAASRLEGPLAATRVAASGCGWLPCSASSCKWLQVGVRGCDCLPVLRVGASGCESGCQYCEWLRVAASGCEWLRVAARLTFTTKLRADDRVPDRKWISGQR